MQQARTKHDLIPYLRSELFIAHQTGMPVIRPLVLAYPRDLAVSNLSDEYLYGSELLVAPVLEKDTGQNVYLPDGLWLDYNDKSALFGRATDSGVGAVDQHSRVRQRRRDHTAR